MRRFTMLSLQSRFALPAVIGLVFALVVPASGQDISDLRRQREQARAAEQEALEQIDLLRADDALVAEVLAEIQSLVDAQTARVAGAQQALAAAESEVLYREQLARDAEAAVAVMREEIAVRAVDSYVGTDTSLEPWLKSGDPNRTAIRLAMLDFAAGSERDLLNCPMSDAITVDHRYDPPSDLDCATSGCVGADGLAGTADDSIDTGLACNHEVDQGAICYEDQEPMDLVMVPKCGNGGTVKWFWNARFDDENTQDIAFGCIDYFTTQVILGVERRGDFSPLGSLAGCFLAPGSGLGIVGTASSRR